MGKRVFILAAISSLLCVVLTSWTWAGQVVTDSHKEWAKSLLSQEKALGDKISDGTVAVLYFINKTGRGDLDPFQKGLAYMLITDLSKVEGTQLVERAKLQALVQELGLGASGLVDPGTAPKVGKLLSAAHIVSGRFSKDELEKFGINPGILQTMGEKLFDLPGVQGLLEEILKMEKIILFQILEQLKKVPTDREIITALEKPLTTSLEALICLFKGFDESDQKNYLLASKYYQCALKADPALSPASNALKELQSLGLIGKTIDQLTFLRSLRDRTSLTDQLVPDDAVRRTRNPRDVERRRELQPPKPDDVDDDKDGYTENQGDCNDHDPNINPGVKEICGDGIDQDCNGSDLICPEDADNDKDGYSTRQGDCNDGNAAIHPGAVEICGDSVDQDCNGSDLICPEDADNDKDGYSIRQGDCNDNNAAIHPGAVEICGDGIDQDCNGSDLLCPEDADNDKDGYSIRQGDCNDNNAAIHPNAVEICGDGIDQDCNGGDLICPEDADNDKDGYSIRQGDCNDNNAAIHPGAIEICGDGIDQDCKGGDLSCNDVDNDGDGYTENQGDCNDNNAAIHPGAIEICGDRIDQDCNGSDLSCADVDNDGDGYTENQGDCNDSNASIHPGAVEVCDKLDNDCNGIIDDIVGAGVESINNENCSDRIDNDCDGLMDGQDPGCSRLL